MPTTCWPLSGMLTQLATVDSGLFAKLQIHTSLTRL